MMKVDVVKSFIAIALSALLAYACYEMCDVERVQMVVAVGALLTFGVTLMLALGVSAQQEGSAVMLKTLSWITFIVEFITNGIFVFLDFSISVYVIVNGLVLVIFMLIYNSIYRTKM